VPRVARIDATNVLFAIREPQVGIEPTTARLRIECSTPELLWQHHIPCMPWRGLEPRRLAAPPPQDGVSTNFTTRAPTFTHSQLFVQRPTSNVQLATTTGATGFEPATSRVTVECSNQAELRPQHHLPRPACTSASQPATCRRSAPSIHQFSNPPIVTRFLAVHPSGAAFTIARRGIEPLSAP
jgi:hypothetical protein